VEDHSEADDRHHPLVGRPGACHREADRHEEDPWAQAGPHRAGNRADGHPHLNAAVDPQTAAAACLQKVAKADRRSDAAGGGHLPQDAVVDPRTAAAVCPQKAAKADRHSSAADGDHLPRDADVLQMAAAACLQKVATACPQKDEPGDGHHGVGPRQA
jgi:hypothetical protein